MGEVELKNHMTNDCMNRPRECKFCHVVQPYEESS